MISPGTANRAPSQVTSHEEARQQDLRRLQHRLHPRDPHAGGAQLLGFPAVPLGECRLAADAAQDPQAGDDVVGAGGERAGLVAVGLLAPV